MTPLKKACSEARPRADCRTRGRLRELFSVDSGMDVTLTCFSQTGNTRQVATAMAGAFRERGARGKNNLSEESDS